MPASTSRLCVREHLLCSTQSHPCVFCAHDRMVDGLLVSEGSWGITKGKWCRDSREISELAEKHQNRTVSEKL